MILDRNIYNKTYMFKDCESLLAFIENDNIVMEYKDNPQTIENKNKVVQNRLLVDIKRFNITTYDELNKWFKSIYRTTRNR